MIKSPFESEVKAYSSLINRVNPLLMTILVLSVVSMNLLANKELLRSDWIALDCGYILSWIPFLIMDMSCRVYGGKIATRLSILAILINLILFGIFKIVASTPGMWGAFYDTHNTDINIALNNTVGGSSWIVIVSAFSMAISSIINSIINTSLARIYRKDSYKTFAIRSFTSTFISQYIDNLIFTVLVSVTLFGWSIKQVLVCSLSAACLELLLEICFSKIGYRLSKQLK